ncbi:hypothetical protein Tco_0617049 [Tanacetum coccineum]
MDVNWNVNSDCSRSVLETLEFSQNFWLRVPVTKKTDEHAPAPKHAPISPNPTPIQPNDYLAYDDEDPEEEPEEEEEPIPEQAPAAPTGFAPQWIGWHDLNNNNGWLIEDDDDDEEEIEA